MLFSYVQSSLLVTTGVLFITGLLALVISSRLQRRITAPIADLSTTMASVSTHQDYR